MLGIQFVVSVDVAEVVPSVRNVRNDFDGITIPLGIRRFEGEKSKDFKHYAQRIASISYQDFNQFGQLIGLEARIDTYPFIIENTSLDSKIFSATVSVDFKLHIDTYQDGVGTNLYNKSSFEYDLLDRKSYPFLEEVAAHITQNIDGIRSYIAPFEHERYNHILPYHLTPTQTNFEVSGEGPYEGTHFYLRDRYIIPDSFDIRRRSIPESLPIRLVNSATSIVNPGDIYLNYRTGEMYTGTDLTKYNPVFIYKIANQCKSFLTTPGAAAIPLGNKNVLTRANKFAEPVDTLQKHKYLNSEVQLSEGFEYSGAKISPALSLVFQNGNLKEYNRNRWS